MQIQNIMQRINGAVNLSLLEKTDKENIYICNECLIPNTEVYYDGLNFIEIMPIEDVRVAQMEMVEKFAKKMKLLAKKNHWKILFQIIDKRIGLQTYINRFDDIPDNQKYDSFVEIYTRSEFGFEILENHYHKIFSYAHLSEERRERLQTLYLKFEDDITIYHGESISFPVHDYYSWTLDEKTAWFFAKRWYGIGEVWERTVPIIEAIDYLTGRNEEEILYDYVKTVS